jgi:VWFA-related protein
VTALSKDFRMNRFILAVAIILALSIVPIAQDVSPSPTPPPLDDGEVVKISTTLIQLDAIVTDQKGRQVTDLTINDFEILENGEKQNITNFSYVSIPKISQENKSKKDKPEAKRRKNQVVVPGRAIRPEEVRRTYAIVIDDLGISFVNYPEMKRAIRKFVNEEVQIGDLVAIIKTGGGSGALQSFTSDKRQLLAAVEKIRWNAYGRGGISNFDPIRTSLKEDLASIRDTAPEGIEEENAAAKSVSDFRTSNFDAGSIGALRYIVRGMSELPGRKSVIFYSEGFSTSESNESLDDPGNIFNQLGKVVELANRSSVVFYTIDPRGLENPDMIFAQDEVRQVVPDAAGKPKSSKREARVAAYRASQVSLRFLAYETGGLPYVNSNNMSKGLEQAMDDQSGYYLIAYVPDEDTFDASKNSFNNIKIKVKKKGLKLRTRRGFYAFTNNPGNDKPVTAGQEMYRALTSPFSVNQIDLALNTLFAINEKNEKTLESLVFIDGKGLAFTEQENGSFEANFDIVLMSLAAKINTVKASRNYTIKVSKENYKRVIEKGFVYRMTIPVKKTGGYQLRVALRDSVSKKVGSASQFIEVPDISNNKLSISSIVLNRFSRKQWQMLQRQTGSVSEKELQYDNSIDNALRVFKHGDVLQFGYYVYNPKLRKEYLLRTRLIKDGKVIIEGDPSPLDRAGSADPKRIETAGAITLGEKLVPGNYVLQVIVSEKKSKKPKGTVTQWIEFEITG